MHLVGTSVSIAYLDSTTSAVVTALSPDEVLQKVTGDLSNEDHWFATLPIADQDGSFILNMGQVAEMHLHRMVLAETGDAHVHPVRP